MSKAIQQQSQGVALPQTAAILAGGLGTRLRSVVADRPKVLAQVAGKPFLTYLLDQLRDAGVKRTALCTGYMADVVHDTFGEQYGPMDLIYSVEESPLGTGGALRQAASQLNTEQLIAMNGDSFTDVSLTELYDFHRKNGAAATLALTKVDDVSRFGGVRLAGDNSLLGFDEKNAAGGPGLINAGIYILEKRLLADVAEGQKVSLERTVFPKWIGKGMFGMPGKGRFLDIGTPETFELAQTFFATDAP